MPKRHAVVDWEPWRSQGMRGVLVGSHKVFYVVDEGSREVFVIRVLYAAMDLGT